MKEKIDFKIINVEVDGVKRSAKIPSKITINTQNRVYVVDDAEKIIYYNLPDEIRSKISTSVIYYFLEWAYYYEDINGSDQTDEYKLDYIERKTEEAEYPLSRDDLKLILNTERIYLKLIGVI